MGLVFVSMRNTCRSALTVLLPWITIGCAGQSGEDLSLSNEAQLFGVYIQAATCIVLTASEEEKRKLTAGMSYVDRRTTAESDLRGMVEQRLKAEELLYELLPQRCPETSRSIVFFSELIEDQRALSIYEAHFVDLVGMAVAIDVSEPVDLRRHFENAYTPIGDSAPLY